MRDKDTQLLTEAYREAAVSRYLIKEGFPGKDKIKKWILGKLDGFKQWLDSEEGQQILKQRGLLKEDFVLQEGMKDWLGLLGIGGIAAALAYYLKMDPDALQSVLDFFPDLLDQITNLFGGGEGEVADTASQFSLGELDLVADYGNGENVDASNVHEYLDAFSEKAKELKIKSNDPNLGSDVRQGYADAAQNLEGVINKLYTVKQQYADITSDLSQHKETLKQLTQMVDQHRSALQRSGQLEDVTNQMTEVQKQIDFMQRLLEAKAGNYAGGDVQGVEAAAKGVEASKAASSWLGRLGQILTPGGENPGLGSLGHVGSQPGAGE
jgi:hypothetical protein